MRGTDPRAWFVKYEVDGRPDDYGWFTIKDGHLMRVIKLMAATDDAYAALWQFYFDMDLGAIFLGSVKLRTLYHADRVEENTPGALARADAMFATDLMPWCIDSW